MRALVTGGAGFIGSHMVRTLLDAGHEVVVLDDLSTGHREAVAPEAKLVVGDVRDAAAAAAALAGVDAVLHFAAKIEVGESVAAPRKYFQGNLVSSLALLEAVLDAGVGTFVLSSTAAVYGMPHEVPIDESHATVPVNPYGETKLAIERALDAYGKAYGLKWAALRYFNAAGAHPDAGLGERHDPESHLIPIVLQVAAGKRKALSIYGTSWPTPDGTCVRDYIHVRDLCDAHLRALEYLGREGGGESGAFNLGTGRGHSVREVVDAVRRVTGREVPTVDAPVRAGDPAVLVAKVDRAAEVLGWRASRPELDGMVRDAWTFALRAPTAPERR
jgi:UDP-glucose 4-epimerase